jgi:hypothetical protein
MGKKPGFGIREKHPGSATLHRSWDYGTDTSSLTAENCFKVHRSSEDYDTDTSSLTAKITSRYIDHEDYDTDTSSLTAKITSRYIDQENYGTDTSCLRAEITSRYIDQEDYDCMILNAFKRKNYFKVHRSGGL